jgi:hypothetical protein
MNKKLIVVIKGGLGNQLFCYSLGRNIALKYNYDLILDLDSGFRYDKIYQRKNCLHHFCIEALRAKPSERMEPLGKYRRKIAGILTDLRLNIHGAFIREKELAFSPLFLRDPKSDPVYFDGYWQSEKYFIENEEIIRNDLKFSGLKPSAANLDMLLKIQNCNAVMIHIRWFIEPGTKSALNEALSSYYKSAVSYMSAHVELPHYFVFSDRPDQVKTYLSDLPADAFTIVDINSTGTAIYDLWLQTHFRYFIIANSTFSWWGAWLSTRKDKIVIAPALKNDGISAWGFEGLIPEHWIQL